MKSLGFAAAAVMLAVAANAYAAADIPPAPKADAVAAEASPTGRAMIQRTKDHIGDWPAFCQTGRDNFKSEAKASGMQLKGLRQIDGFGPGEVQAVIKYFATACEETGHPAP